MKCSCPVCIPRIYSEKILRTSNVFLRVFSDFFFHKSNCEIRSSSFRKILRWIRVLELFLWKTSMGKIKTLYYVDIFYPKISFRLFMHTTENTWKWMKNTLLHERFTNFFLPFTIVSLLLSGVEWKSKTCTL